MKKIKAFTLAEVLITLAIIGVVAALTIPTVVTNYKAKALETQKKKAMSVLANGFRLLMANDDVSSLQDTNLANCEENDKECYANEVKRMFNVISDNTSENDIFETNYQFESEPRAVWTNNLIKYAFITSDGMIFGLHPMYPPDSPIEMDVIVDLNGVKNPNKGAEDLCRFVITNTGSIMDYCADMTDWGAPLPGPHPHGNCHWEPGLCWDNGNGHWACSPGQMVCD